MGLGLDLVGREPESGYAKITRGPPVLVIDILVSLDPTSPLVTVITVFLVTVITAHLALRR